jgi:aerobic-type carbon monoxide dehydrogenase small subunit (CoxS/CutS family)
MILASHYLLTRKPDSSEEEIRRGLAGNLCMCTGYTQILDAVKEAGREYKKE